MRSRRLFIAVGVMLLCGLPWGQAHDCRSLPTGVGDRTSHVPKIVLVTGATGFIGRHVVQMLNAKGIVPRVLTRWGTNAGRLDGLRVQFVSGDIIRMDSLLSVMADVDSVIHLAAKVSDYGSRQEFEHTNIQGTHNVLDAARLAGVKRFVHFSTVDVFGVRRDAQFDDESLVRESGYAYSDTKLAAELLALTYYDRYHLPVAIIRPTWVFGPGDQTFIPELLNALAHRLPVYFGSGRNVIALSYVENLVQAVWLLLTSPRAVGEAFTFNDGHMAWQDFVEAIIQDLPLKPPPFALPYPVAMMTASVMEKLWVSLGIQNRPPLTPFAVAALGNNMQYSNALLRTHLGYEPPIPISEGIRRTITWLKSQDLTALKKK